MSESEQLMSICPRYTYQQTIELVDIIPILDFSKRVCKNSFCDIVNNFSHRLNSLIEINRPSLYVKQTVSRTVLLLDRASYIIMIVCSLRSSMT